MALTRGCSTPYKNSWPMMHSLSPFRTAIRSGIVCSAETSVAVTVSAESIPSQLQRRATCAIFFDRAYIIGNPIHHQRVSHFRLLQKIRRPDEQANHADSIHPAWLELLFERWRFDDPGDRNRIAAVLRLIENDDSILFGPEGSETDPVHVRHQIVERQVD